MWPGRHGRWDGQTLVPGYFYDNAGNLTEVKDTSGSNTVAGYDYTPAGLLNEASFKDHLNNSHTLTHVWDAGSNRVSMTNGDLDQWDFVYDTTAGIPAVIEETTPNGTNYYIREPGGSLIARLNSTEGTRYYHFDELGSTRLLTNSSGAVTDRYAYDAYGSLLSHDASTGSVNQPYQYVGQLGYYTHYMEPDFGLLQLGVRFYDAEVGRFTQRDQLLFFVNRYIYASDNPGVRVDPTGYFDWDSQDGQYYMCVAAAVLNYLGFPCEEEWMKAHAERAVKELLKRLEEAYAKKHAPKRIARMLYEWARDLGIPHRFRPNGNWIRKAIGRCNLVMEAINTYNLLKDLYDCQHKYYGIF